MLISCPRPRPPRPCGLLKEGLSWPSSSVIWPCLPQTRFSKTLRCFIAQMASPHTSQITFSPRLCSFFSLHRSLRLSKFNPSSLRFSNLNIENEACGGSQNPAQSQTHPLTVCSSQDTTSLLPTSSLSASLTPGSEKDPESRDGEGETSGKRPRPA